jgi:hypothetical protein
MGRVPGKGFVEVSVEMEAKLELWWNFNCFKATTVDQLVKQFRNFEPKKKRSCRCKPA